MDPLVIGGAIAVDLCLGELPARWHPVVWMGWCIKRVVQRAPREGARALVVGTLLAVALPALSFAVVRFTLGALDPLGAAADAASVLVLSTTFSARLLIAEVRGLGALLSAGDLDGARRYLPRLCSRSPDDLFEADLAAAGLGSLAENTSDSIVAPWFWCVAFGIPGAMAYRAVNTLDAMIGYRGEFERLGKASARLDDVANWIPARLTACFMLLAGAVVGLPVVRGLRVAGRDAGRTASPNGGWPMAAMAGLLGVRVDKPGVYALFPEGSPASAEALRYGTRVASGAAVVAGAAWIGWSLCAAR